MPGMHLCACLCTTRGIQGSGSSKHWHFPVSYKGVLITRGFSFRVIKMADFMALFCTSLLAAPGHHLWVPLSSLWKRWPCAVCLCHLLENSLITKALCSGFVLYLKQLCCGSKRYPATRSRYESHLCWVGAPFWGFSDRIPYAGKMFPQVGHTSSVTVLSAYLPQG